MFLSGMAFALAAMLSCTNHGHVTADENAADASPTDVGGSRDVSSTLTMTLTADTHAAQLRTGVIHVPVGAHGTLLAGPFVVTTLLQNTKSTTGGTATVELYFSPGSCDANFEVRQTFLSLTSSTSGGFSGRLWVPPTINLCYASSATGPVDDPNLSFSGFVPY